MSVLLAIDPGYTRIARSRTKWTDRNAVAWFYNGELQYGAYWSEMDAFARVSVAAPDTVVIEKPTAYSTGAPGRGQAPGEKNVPPNDLIDLAAAGFLLAGRFRCPVVELLAERWKGSIAKPVCHRRMLAVLTPAERALLPAGSEAKVAEAVRVLGVTGKCPSYKWHGVDVLDAVSLGLVYLGRLDLGGNWK